MVHVEDRGYQFADGIYEYIAFYNGQLLDGGLHLDRLERSLRGLAMGMPTARRAMEIVMAELIARNGRRDGGLYMQVTRGVARRDHAFPRQVKPAFVMTVCAAKTPATQEARSGVRVISHADIRWGRRDIKSVSLLANILAKQEAAAARAREAWLVDGGVVTEGSASNAYIVSGRGELVTHPANEKILAGITRDIVLQLARKAGIPVVETPFTPAQALDAAEAFMTSTSANVLPVVKLDDRLIGSGRPGALTLQLQALYAEHILEQTGKQLS
jgi:D-alanine transaminase